MGIFDLIFGVETTVHEDGSSTERYKDNTVVNKDPNGKTTEIVTEERHGLFGLWGDYEKVTRDENGKILNVQSMNQD